MKRLIFFILATVIVTTFAVSNSHHVEMSLIFGAPVQMRMIFLLAGVFTAGVISTLGFQEWAAIKRRRKAEALRKEAEDKSTVKDLLDGVD
jgi:uncharacterized integral membrane protein